jgi:HEAT repeat protein
VSPSTAGDRPSENQFRHFAEHEPETLLDLLRRRALSPGFLTYAAEIAGRNIPTVEVVPVLLPLLQDPSPLVREGAVLGLEEHRTPEVLAALSEVARLDASPGVRAAARSAVDEL